MRAVSRSRWARMGTHGAVTAPARDTEVGPRAVGRGGAAVRHPMGDSLYESWIQPMQGASVWSVKSERFGETERAFVSREQRAELGGFAVHPAAGAQTS